jgi:TatD DNase family protein
VYVDVHSHLTHEDFASDLPEVIARAEQSGLTAIVVNGLEPKSNQRILQLAQQYPVIKPALGIYPIEAINDVVSNLPFPIKKFDVLEEIASIRRQVAAGHVFAIGECGLDGHWVGEETFAAQEKVFEQLIGIALEFDKPIIIHTRKREERSMEILAAHGVKRVDFHCYGGKSKLALRAAEQHGWYFSIPANARNNESFRKLLKELPQELVLTETDCPYLAPVRGQRNEPANVVGTIALMAELRNWTEQQAKAQVWQNFQRLFQV